MYLGNKEVSLEGRFNLEESIVFRQADTEWNRPQCRDRVSRGHEKMRDSVLAIWLDLRLSGYVGLQLSLEFTLS